MVYESLLRGLSGDVAGKGMSIMVPDTRVLAEGSTHSSRVPGVFHVGILIAKEIAGKAAVVLDVGID
jgi:hypothetical protein